jgi:hypothetical protein
MTVAMARQRAALPNAPKAGKESYFPSWTTSWAGAKAALGADSTNATRLQILFWRMTKRYKSSVTQVKNKM